MTSKEYQEMYKQLKGRPPADNMPLQEIRTGFETFLSNFPPENDIIFEPCAIASLDGIYALAPNANKKHVILFFFGGAYNAGSVMSHKDLMGRISRATRVAVLGINYRLAPENPFPAALEDGLAVYRKLLESYQPSQIIFGGSSAGGGLVLSLCLKLKEEKLPQPVAAFCISPWIDLTFQFPSIETNAEKDWLRLPRLKNAVKDYCQGKDPKESLISPYFGDLHGLPPLLIQTGTWDILHDEAVAFAKKAHGCGVKVVLQEEKEMVHCWHLFASKVPEAQAAIDKIGQFIKMFNS